MLFKQRSESIFLGGGETGSTYLHACTGITDSKQSLILINFCIKQNRPRYVHIPRSVKYVHVPRSVLLFCCKHKFDESRCQLEAVCTHTKCTSWHGTYLDPVSPPPRGDRPEGKEGFVSQVPLAWLLDLVPVWEKILHLLKTVRHLFHFVKKIDWTRACLK